MQNLTHIICGLCTFTSSVTNTACLLVNIYISIFGGFMFKYLFYQLFVGGYTSCACSYIHKHVDPRSREIIFLEDASFWLVKLILILPLPLAFFTIMGLPITPRNAPILIMALTVSCPVTKKLLAF